MTDNLINIPVLVGPTAVGKTAVAVLVARQFNGEIISADSRQVYRGLEIGSGAPSRQELEAVPHHLVSCLSPDRRLSAGEFAGLADQAIDSVRRRGSLPIVVGGSGLYVRSLINGLSPIPASSESLRIELQAEIDRRGMAEMIEELKSVDPEYAVKVGLKDRQRLIRALEVWRLTGRPFSDWHHEISNQSRYQPQIWGLTRPREEIWELIEHRVNKMLKAGWLKEIRNLADQYHGFDKLPVTIIEGLGYRDLIEYLKGNTSRTEAIEKTIIATRQFAKRQMTWFKADDRIIWLEESGPKAVRNWTEILIQQFIDAGFKPNVNPNDLETPLIFQGSE